MIQEKIQSKNRLKLSSDLTICELSMLLSIDGLSYCVYDPQLVDVLYLKQYKFTDTLNDEAKLLQYLKKLYKKDRILNAKYSKVKVAYHDQLSTIVPEEWYDDSAQYDYLKYDVGVLETDQFLVDDIPDVKGKNVYVLRSDCDNFFYEKYRDLYVKQHASSVLLSGLIKYFIGAKKPYFLVNVHDSMIQIMCISQDKLQFYNSFVFVTKEDFMYYILFVMEQLALDPDKQPVVLLGDIFLDDELYAIMYRYVRYINFFNVNNFNVSDEFYELNPEIQRHYFFELLNQL